MSQNGNASHNIQATRQRIQLLLEEIPAETLPIFEQLLLSMRQQKPSAKDKDNLPVVFLPATSLKKWSLLLEEGYEGDALEDTESLYDDI